MGKMIRSTPPPHSSHGGHSHSGTAPRHQSSSGSGGSYHGGNNYDGDGRSSHSSQSHQNSGGSVHHSGGYHQGGSQHQAYQGSQGRGSASGPYYNRSQGSSSNYAANKVSQQSDLRLANGEERKTNRDSSYESKAGHPHSSMGSHGPKDQRKAYAGTSREN